MGNNASVVLLDPNPQVVVYDVRRTKAPRIKVVGERSAAVTNSMMILTRARVVGGAESKGVSRLFFLPGVKTRGKPQ